MKHILAVLVAFLLVMGSVSAYCACIKGGKCGCSDDPYYEGMENVSVWVDKEDAKPDERWEQATDRPAGEALDTFEDTRDDFYQWENRIEIKMKKACDSENIEVQIFFRGKALPGAKVKLYSHAGGRKYVSEVQADGKGWAIFGPKDRGKYDIVAEKNGYNFGQKIFEIDICKIGTEKEGKIYSENYEENIYEESEFERKITIDVREGYKRIFERMELADGSVGTRVEIQVGGEEKENGKEYMLWEKVPKKIANNAKQIGFENTYPDEIFEEGEFVKIGWMLNSEYNGDVAREYVILNNVERSGAYNFGAPKIKEKTEVVEKGFIESLLEGIFGIFSI
ncbi:MAG: hypothetical protein ABIH83_00100 [Candidatus Micrarchaeota archaeon]